MGKIDLKNKVVVIAGGAKNLGGLISREIAKQGSKIVVHYHSNSSKSYAEDTVKAVKAAGGDAFLIQSDLTKVENVQKLFQAAKDKYGRVDVAINTAGMVLKKPILETSEAEYDLMFGVNTKAAFFFMQEAGKHLEDHGKIITILTSLLGAFTGMYATYAGAKASVEHFTRAAAKELMGKGISVNTVAPGPMDTPFFYAQETPEAVAYLKSNAMGNDLTKIEDIVPIITFLATDGWWINGQTILANGGFTTK